MRGWSDEWGRGTEVPDAYRSAKYLRLVVHQDIDRRKKKKKKSNGFYNVELQQSKHE